MYICQFTCHLFGWLRSEPVCFSVYLLVYLSVHLPFCLSVCICQPLFLSICLLVCLPLYLFVYLPVFLSACLFVCLTASFSLSVCLSVCLPLSLSVFLSICLSAYLFVCLLLCLSTSLSFSPSSCPSFDPSVHMPASFLVWVARHTIIIGGTTYTTVQQYQAWILMFQAVRSKLPPSSPASPPVADTTLPPEKEKKLRNLKKVKYHLIPQPTQQNTKSLKCVQCCQLIKKNTFNKKFEQTHHQKWESINQSLEISI